MKKDYNFVRVNIKISNDIKKYFEEKSLETGVAQSSLIALALEEYIFNKEILKKDLRK